MHCFATVPGSLSSSFTTTRLHAFRPRCPVLPLAIDGTGLVIAALPLQRAALAVGAAEGGAHGLHPVAAGAARGGALAAALGAVRPDTPITPHTVSRTWKSALLALLGRHGWVAWRPTVHLRINLPCPAAVANAATHGAFGPVLPVHELAIFCTGFLVAFLEVTSFPGTIVSIAQCNPRHVAITTLISTTAKCGAIAPSSPVRPKTVLRASNFRT
mmetsp:Transcript_956/g.1532  ORF Transcript_956/g.1532 Transcript_956/m.1532 type:complete len:215 (-) Transcript_956:1765-2409(-)